MQIPYIHDIYNCCMLYSSDNSTQATAWSAFAMKVNGPGTVQVEATNLGTMDIQINGVQQNFVDVQTQEFDGTSFLFLLSMNSANQFSDITKYTYISPPFLF